MHLCNGGTQARGRCGKETRGELSALKTGEDMIFKCVSCVSTGARFAKSASPIGTLPSPSDRSSGSGRGRLSEAVGSCCLVLTLRWASEEALARTMTSRWEAIERAEVPQLCGDDGDREVCDAPPEPADTSDDEQLRAELKADEDETEEISRESDCCDGLSGMRREQRVAAHMGPSGEGHLERPPTAAPSSERPSLF